MPTVSYLSNKVSQLSSCNSGASTKIKNSNDAHEMISEWFEQNNKPVTVQSLTDALGSRVAKSLVQKILEQLTEIQFLQTKDLKKIRFYYYCSNNEYRGVVDASSDIKEELCKEPSQTTVKEFCEQEFAESVCSEELEVKSDENNVLNDNKTECFGTNEQCENHSLQNSNTNDVPSLIDKIMCIRQLIATSQTLKMKLSKLQTSTERKVKVQEVQRNVQTLLHEVETLKEYAERSRTNEINQQLEIKKRELEELIDVSSKIRLLWHDRKYLANTLLEVVSTELTNKADVIEKLCLHPGDELNLMTL